LNHTDILGREIRICFKKDHKTVDPEANVYIKNLGENVRGKQVEEEFSPFGAIFSCTVKYDENGKHLGYGYVQFKEKEAAANAIQKLDGTNLLGSKISVQKFIPRGKRNIMNWKTNLYVKGFPKDWNKAKVEQFINDKFKPIGTTSSICIVENPKLGRCFAFVAFEKDEKAAEAIKSFNDIQVGNETLYVGYAQKKTERRRKLAEEFAKQTNETNLFIKSLREDVTEETLKQIFSAYGEITSVAVQESTRIPKSIESHGVKLKFGFINFKSDACAKKAFIEAKKSPEVKKLISEFHNDSKDFLYFAQPKSVREQYLKMVRKNLQSTTMLQTQMNMFKMMMQQMNSNKKMFPAAQKRGGKAGAQPAAAPGVVNPGMMPMMGQAGMDGSTVPMMNMEFMNFVRHPMMMMPGMGMPGFNPAQFTGTPAVPIQQPQIAVPAAPAKVNLD
jgi:polyadenylate-binding protein